MADTVAWLHADQVGSTRVLTDQNGNNLVQCNQNSYYAQGSLLTYAPFGGELDCTQSQAEYKFTGKPRDEESGLDYFGARYHASKLGDFCRRIRREQGFPVSPTRRVGICTAMPRTTR